MVAFHKMIDILCCLLRLMCSFHGRIFFLHFGNLAMGKIGIFCTYPACNHFYRTIRFELLFFFHSSQHILCFSCLFIKDTLKGILLFLRYLLSCSFGLFPGFLCLILQSV